MQRALVAPRFVVSTRSQNSSLRATRFEGRLGSLKVGFTLVGVLASLVLATIVAIKSNDEQARVDRQNQTQLATKSIDDRLNSYDAKVERADAASRSPRVQGVGAAHLVDSRDVAPYAAEVNERSQNTEPAYPGFAIHSDTQAPRILPIDYIEPQVGSEIAFGLDFLSEPNYRPTATLARDTAGVVCAGFRTDDLVSGTSGLLAEAVETELVAVPILTTARHLFDVRRLKWSDDHDRQRRSYICAERVTMQAPDLATLIGEAGFGQLMSGDDPQGRWKTNGTSDELVNSLAWFERTLKIVADDDTAVVSMVERSMPFIIVGAGLLVAATLLSIAQARRSTRRRAVALAAEMTEELNALNEATSEAIVTVNEAGLVVGWNSGAERIFSRTAHEMLGQPVLDLVPEAHRGELMDLAIDFKSDGVLLRNGLRRDGELFPIEMSVSSWTAHADNFRTAFIRDVTDRVEDEIEIRETIELLTSVLGAATEMSLIATDSDGLISVFNAGAERMLGYKAANLVGAATVFRLHDPAEVAERANELGVDPTPDVFGTEVCEGLAKTKSWTYIQKDGGRVPVELTVTPRYNVKGKMIGAIGVAVDITARLAAEAEQQAALEQQQEVVTELAAVDRAKSEFLSTISHEFRTPLNSIIGYAELLSESLGAVQSAEQREMLALIEKNAQRQFALVEDILSLSQIQSGFFQVREQQCDGAMILRSASEAVAVLAADRNISVRLDVDDLPHIVGDPEQLERAFAHLLTNAVKFSPASGAIEVTAVANESLVVTVTDHGIGIPAADQAQLFTPFFRSRSSEEQAFQGAGLGLAIVANIIERHHGQIHLESVEGSGTTVTVALPLSEQCASPQSLQGVR
jgi:PAS domain S-box-containing protein